MKKALFTLCLVVVCSIFLSKVYAQDDFTQGSNYYLMTLDQVSADKIGAKNIAADLRPDNLARFLYVWSNTYTAGTTSGPNWNGEVGEFVSLTVASVGWSGIGFAAVGTPVNMSGITSDYTFHIAMKSTATNSHIVALRGGNGLEARVCIGATAFVDGALTYQPYTNFIRDGKWHLVEIPISVFMNLGLRYPEPFTDNYFYMMSGNNPGKTIDIDAVFIYKKTGNRINTSSTNLSGFTYNKGSGPSSEQVLTLSGASLSSNIVVTAPANYQISKTSGTGFSNTPITLLQSGGSVLSTPIYVRLKAGLNSGNYNDSIIVSSTGVASQKIMCSGTVVGPSITKSASSISGLNYNKSSGPSSEQSFTLSGSVLESTITLTPTSNIQISKTSGAGFVNTPLTLTPIGGSVSTTTIYVRLKAGLNFADYNAENIAITSTNVVTQNVACSGTVVGPTITSSLNSISGINYNRGAGPSAAKICTISASLLEANMVITPSTNYEISTNNSTYSSIPISLTPVSGTISAMSLYIRLKSGLNSGSYSENIMITSTGALTKTIACSGSVLGPNVVVSTSMLNGFNYLFDNGPSDQQSFSVSGADLTSNITVTTNSNFQISTVSGGSFSTSAITLTPTSKIVNPTTVYVRLKAGLSGANYNGDISITSTNADTKTVSCSGTVDNGSGLTYIATVPAATKACYIAGTMTSGIMQAMIKSDATHYTITIPGATFSDTYLFYSGPNVMYVEQDANGVAISARSFSANNLVATWAAVYELSTPLNIISNSRIKVYSIQSNIVVEGTSAGETISIITADGVQLQNIKSKGDRIVITAPQGTTYLVKTATKTVKVAF